ncbi:hypothetical protein TcasGA2_TC031713 [Tribolium castaneum]|nr:hypothetical protein TcasGA2_TC031713 [Tribolium castaneum]
MLSWDIIVWTSENAIDFVPSIWKNEDGTAYKYSCGMSDHTKRQFIYECKDLTKNYIWCNAKIKKTQISILKKAKNLCRKGEENLESSDEDEDNCTVRKRKPNKRFIEDSSSNDADLPSKKTVTEIMKIFPLHKEKKFQVPCSNKIAPRPISQSSVFNDSRSTLTMTSTSTMVSPNIIDHTNDIRSEESMGADKRFTKILYFMEEVNKKLNNLENIVLGQASCGTSTFNNNNNSVNPFSLPNDIKLFNELVHGLFLLGGEDSHKAVFAMLNKLITKDLALKYSGCGKKKKLAFFSLKSIFDAISAALRKRFPSVLDIDIKKSIGVFWHQPNPVFKEVISSGVLFYRCGNNYYGDFMLCFWLHRAPKKGNNISFHRFPQDMELKKKWVIALKRKNFNPTTASRVCSKHFEKKDFVFQFGKLILMTNAVPSIFAFPDHLQKKRTARRVLVRNEILTNKPDDVPGSSSYNEVLEPVTPLQEPQEITSSVIAPVNNEMLNISKRQRNRRFPVFLGDFCEDMDVPARAKKMFELSKKIINKQRRTIKYLQNKTYRLKKN